jgi:hypothetical protein
LPIRWFSNRIGRDPIDVRRRNCGERGNRRADLVRSLYKKGPLDPAQLPFLPPGDGFQSVEVVGHDVDLRLVSPQWKTGKRDTG